MVLSKEEELQQARERVAQLEVEIESGSDLSEVDDEEDEFEDVAIPVSPKVAQLQEAYDAAVAEGKQDVVFAIKAQLARENQPTPQLDASLIHDLEAKIEKARQDGNTAASIQYKAELAQEQAKSALTPEGVPAQPLVSQNGATSDEARAQVSTDELRAKLEEAEKAGNRNEIARIKLDLARRFAGR